MGGGSSKAQKKAPPAAAPAAPARKPSNATPPPPEPTILVAKFERWQGETRCDPGFGSDEDDNQDVVLLDKIEELRAIVAGVFDGHGQNGRKVAEACRAHICDAIRKHAPPVDQLTQLDWLNDCFITLDQYVASELREGLSESGCAGTVVIYMPEQKLMFTANVGDSKAVLGGAEQPIKSLTVDHLPSLDVERKRIVAAGGRVAASDDVQLGTLGELRVWKGASTMPGLTISRSIGDSVAKEVGVIATPYAQRIDFGKMQQAAGNKLVVVASPGIWKVFSPKELLELLGKEKTVAAAADKAITEARNRWEELWQGENTSIVVLTLPT